MLTFVKRIILCLLREQIETALKAADSLADQVAKDNLVHIIGRGSRRFPLFERIHATIQGLHLAHCVKCQTLDNVLFRKNECYEVKDRDVCKVLRNQVCYYKGDKSLGDPNFGVAQACEILKRFGPTSNCILTSTCAKSKICCVNPAFQQKILE